jgi:signal transduction histidine kinase
VEAARFAAPPDTLIAVERGERGPLLVEGDAARLEQVATNLLANATRHAPAGGHIRVALGRDGASAVFSVADDGGGIDPELLPRIFEPFVRGPEHRGTVRGRLGLGLPLVRHIVTLHGGTVVAASAGRGRGSVFTVRLPRTDAGAAG